MPERLRPLSGLDAAFLYLEAAGTPMHVGSLMLLAPPKRRGVDFTRALRAHVRERLPRASVLRRVLQPAPLGLTHPLWRDVDDVDLEVHIVERRLPKPGTRAQLDALVARLQAQFLPRERPLWQFTVIHGLAGGEIALYTKVHHALLDGQGGVALAQALLDVAPQAPSRRARSRARASESSPPPTRAVAAVALRATVAQFAKLVRAMPETLKLAGAALATPAALAGGLKSLVLSAPRTIFNRKLGARRSFATLSLPLHEVKAASRTLGVSLNDFVLAAVSGALREYLLRHDALPRRSLVAAMPVSLRGSGDAEVDNQVTMLQCALATDLAAPRDRLRAIAAGTVSIKQRVALTKHLIPTDFPGFAAPIWASGISRLWGSGRTAERLPALANLVVSNVPGPPVPLYLAGARLVETYPVSIVTHGLGLNITLQSYAGRLEFGLIADAAAVPRAAVLADGIARACKELFDIAKTVDA